MLCSSILLDMLGWPIFLDDLGYGLKSVCFLRIPFLSFFLSFSLSLFSLLFSSLFFFSPSFSLSSLSFFFFSLDLLYISNITSPDADLCHLSWRFVYIGSSLLTRTISVFVLHLFPLEGRDTLEKDYGPIIVFDLQKTIFTWDVYTTCICILHTYD